MDMNQYLSMFIEESKEHLQSINENLLFLENEPENLAIVSEIFRSAHTLKGMAATMGYEDLAALTHEMENVLDLVRNKKLKVDSEIMDIIFKSVDKLEGMLLSIIDGGDGKANVAQIVAELMAIVNGESAAVGKTLSSNKDSQLKGLKIEDLYFNEYEVSVLDQSLQSGYKIYHLQVDLQKNVSLKAARAYMIFDALESMGEILKSSPTVEELEEERFDLTFEITLITHRQPYEVEKAILNISEIKSVQLLQLTEELLKGEVEAASSKVQEEKNVSKEQMNIEKEKQQANLHKRAPGKTIRVDIERLEILMNLFSELVIDRGRLEQIARELKDHDLNETVEHMNRISTNLQDIILKMRMVPIEQVFNRFPRMVRDLAKDLNKKVSLRISGAETELDRTVIDEIGDPLVHLLRNAIDHGLESTDERIRKGKLETGKIQLKAYHSGNYVFIEITDDGNGISREKILNRSIERGIITEATKDSLTDHQVYQLLFVPGFSTAESISDISGRGVGLDVVKNKIESLGGSVSVNSKLGVGTTFSIQLPITLSIISAMLVQIEDEKYAIPLSSIMETAVFKLSEILLAHGQRVIDFRGKVVPLVNLREIFDVPGQDESKEEIYVVIVRKGDKMAGLVVDSFIGQQEIVLKTLGKYLTNVFAISGATILGDGNVALIIDPNALIQ